MTLNCKVEESMLPEFWKLEAIGILEEKEVTTHEVEILNNFTTGYDWFTIVIK